MTAGQAVYINEDEIEITANRTTQPISVRKRSKQLTETDMDQK
jgi:hypothetical protein